MALALPQEDFSCTRLECLSSSARHPRIGTLGGNSCVMAAISFALCASVYACMLVECNSCVRMRACVCVCVCVHTVNVVWVRVTTKLKDKVYPLLVSTN